MYIGVDYYPEHWPRKRWETDAKLMREAGLNVVRLAEFAWVMMEPEEGRFDFAWLDDAIGVLAKYDISVILGTPTAVMPAWCARKYPDTLRMEKDGRRLRWGIRKNNCMTSAAYRLLSQRITQAMTEHFAKVPNIIGWQTDNEFDGSQCFCQTCQHEFQDYLKRKYASLAEMNRAWGTHFWGHTYHRWDEVPLPDNEGGSNPSALLDFRRFTSWLDCRFQHEQVQIMRKVCPKHFITHNLMGTFPPNVDYYDLSKDLDHVSWDNYPITEKVETHYHAGCAADLMRGVKRRNFWIMEQTVGPHGWGGFGRNVRPGEIFKIAMQQIAHGADHIMWFRWRSCTAGREQYWHGVLGHDGKPMRRYREVKQCATSFNKIEKQLAGTTLKSKVAMIFDYDSRWAFSFQPAYNGQNNYVDATRRYYDALFRAGANVDMIHPSQDLSVYKVVFAPHLYVMPDDLAKRLSDFVKNGGVLVTDCRSGIKDATSLCHDRTLPGLLSDCLGIKIEEYESTNSIEYPAEGVGPLAGEWTSILFADWVTVNGAKSLCNYKPWHMKKFAMATRNSFGRGVGYYVGTIAKQPEFYDALIGDVLSSARIKPPVKPPQGVEVTLREGNGRKLLFAINHMEEPRKLVVPAGTRNLIDGTINDGNIVLGPLGVAVLKLK